MNNIEVHVFIFCLQNVVKPYDLVIDVQGFQSSTSQMIIKELAIVSVDGKQSHYALFESPVPFSELNTKAQNTAKWLTLNHHNLPYEIGSIPYCNMPDVILLCMNVQSDAAIYAKGNDKCKFVASIIHKHVYNVEQFGCENFENLCKTSNKYCEFHSDGKFACALHHANVIKHFLQNML